MYWNAEQGRELAFFLGLTLTWDVLKWQCAVQWIECSKININMRCIEMQQSVEECGS